jgi:hypothetical protein
MNREELQFLRLTRRAVWSIIDRSRQAGNVWTRTYPICGRLTRMTAKHAPVKHDAR